MTIARYLYQIGYGAGLTNCLLVYLFPTIVMVNKDFQIEK